MKLTVSRIDQIAVDDRCVSSGGGNHSGCAPQRRSRGQVEELILIVSTGTLHGFLALYT
jgi:hypothetical protein